MKKFAATALVLAAAATGLRGRELVLPDQAPPPDGPAIPVKMTPDPAGDHVLVLKDGSRLHGKLVAFGKSEVVWQRADTASPLVFQPADVKRIILASSVEKPAGKAGATLKLAGGDWLTGKLTALKDGKFQLALDGAGTIGIDRKRVEWLHLSKTASTDAYEGPSGPMGLSGWMMMPQFGWDYADGSIVAKAALQGQGHLSRSFSQLNDKLDIEFTTTDGGNQFRSLNFSLSANGGTDVNARSGYSFSINSNNISVRSYTGNNQKNFFANIQQDKNAAKQTRYRILHDRRTGKMRLLVNGEKIADWDLQPATELQNGVTLRWQPTYSDPNTPWTLSKVRVQPWDGSLDAAAKPDEAGKDLLLTLKPQVKEPPVGWPIVNGVPVDAVTKQKVTKPRQTGSLEGISEESLKFSGEDFPRTDDFYIRMGAPVSEPPADAVARIALSRGEFDVAALGFRNGEATVRTTFAGDAVIPLAALRTIEFPHRQNAADKALAEGSDKLVFQNGDELNGAFAGISKDQKLTWKLRGEGKPVDFPTGCIAGITLADAAVQAPAKGAGTEAATGAAPQKPAAPAAAVRFRNRDWLPGNLLQLDKTHLRFQGSIAKDLHIGRAEVQAIYFARNGSLPVWDGAASPQSWISSAVGNNITYGGGFRGRGVIHLNGGVLNLGGGPPSDPARQKIDTSWRYLGGAFMLPLGNAAYGNGGSLQRSFDSLPEKVEVSFDISAREGSPQYVINLFQENGQGIMINGNWDSAYIYDQTARKRPVSNIESINVNFGEGIRKDTKRRSFRFLADRRSGDVAMIVNDTLVAEFGLKGRREFARPGNLIDINPRTNNASATVSNLWVGPWSGIMPKVPKAGSITKDLSRLNVEKEKEQPAGAADDKQAPPGSDALLLANGDEVTGAIENSNGAELRMQSELGALDIPTSRILAAEFGNTASQVSKGTRLFLRGGGTFTVDSLQVAEGKVTCHSVVAGDLTFNADALSEIVFLPAGSPMPEDANYIKTLGTEIFPGGGAYEEFGWQRFEGGLQIQGEGKVIINGNIILN